MADQFDKRALLIAGPTASGKSGVALRLARERGGVIINADALQVYRELSILSARPSAEDEALIPHRLYGHVSGRENHSVARWLADATAALDAAWNEGRLPIITGGSGLYFKVLEQGLAEVPPIDPAIREKWRRFTGDLHGALAARDPTSAQRLDPRDRQRLVRALEVVESTGKPLPHWQAVAQQGAALAGVRVERMFLAVPRAELHARAEGRLDQMIVAGAVDEVHAVMALDPDLPMMKAIGVPELAAHVRGEMSLQEATAMAKTATRHYIKRQLTWWRGQMAGWESV